MKKVSFAGNSACECATNTENNAGRIAVRSEPAKIAISYFLTPRNTLRLPPSWLADTSFMQCALSVRAARGIADRVDANARDACCKPIIEKPASPSTTLMVTLSHAWRPGIAQFAQRARSCAE
ncbi:hypothetical protein [Lysobacter capsici]|uniref:hypothetical protein n=1 Tax=Lysobacter capsici TaxID=435897 RepID=UPI00287B6887|nr:hypothetical protein [Lysobacter capsici]WND81735.1 hypothetical protein RJ610_05035 [Lysobacter capsici]WND86931.1 hypothetical protein RJ609_05035 [Lysobacter capsici]